MHRMMPQEVPTTSVNELPDSAVVLDVREDDEWQAGHIDGAQHIPLGELGERVAELPKESRIVAVCRSGVSFMSRLNPKATSENGSATRNTNWSDEAYACTIAAWKCAI